MTLTKKQTFSLAFSSVLFIYLACTIIAYTTKFQLYPDKISLAIILDLLITAPVVYYLVIRRLAISRISTLRIFLIGVLIAGLILSKTDNQFLRIIKTWISPAIELSLIGYIIRKFRKATAAVREKENNSGDFLVHCRAILSSVMGSSKVANIFASEVAVFYYIFSSKDKVVDNKTRFSSYKENGVVLVLSTFLCLFVIETAGMHFLFARWNITFAWILTGLSLYTCMQLFAHIKAVRKRSIIISKSALLLRNGLFGGEANIRFENIDRVEVTKKTLLAPGVIKLALIKGLENHNTAIHLVEPVTVIKAFGITRKAKILMVQVDQQKGFMEAMKDAGVI